MKLQIVGVLCVLGAPLRAVAQQASNLSSPLAPATAATTPTEAPSAPSSSSATPPRASAALLPVTDATRPVGSFTPAEGSPDAFAARAILTAPPPIGPAWSAVAARPMGVFGAPGSGVTFTTGDDFFTVNIRGRVQVRDGVTVATSATAAPTATNELTVRTARILVSGTVFSRSIQYGMQLGFAPSDIDTTAGNTPSPLYDAWLGSTHLRDFNVRIGQFLVPFDRARANAEWGLQFVDRASIARELGLDRDLGVDIGSSNVGGVNLFGYRVGLYGGDGRNRFNSNPGFLFVARMQFNPLGAFDDTVEGDIQRLPRPRLSIGGAVAYNMLSDRASSTSGAVYSSANQSIPGFDYVHAAADITFKWRGVSLLGQFLYRQAVQDQATQTTRLANGMTTTADVTSRSAWGYLAQIGVMATAHLEFAARWEQIVPLGSTADMSLLRAVSTQGHIAAIGLNWYQWGHGFKAQTDYQYMFGNDAAHGSHVGRLMLQFSI
jgi:hypothetical protein